MTRKRLLVLAPVVLALVSAGLVCTVALGCKTSKCSKPKAKMEQSQAEQARADRGEKSKKPCNYSQATRSDERPSMKPDTRKKKCKVKRSCSRGYPTQAINPWKILGSALIAWYAVGLVVVLAMLIGRGKKNQQRRREEDEHVDFGDHHDDDEFI